MFNSATALLKGIQGKFQNALDAAPQTELEKVAFQAPSEELFESFWIPGTTPAIQKLVDRLDFGSMQDFELKVFNDDFGAGFKVDKNVLNDSKKYLSGGVELHIRGMLEKYKSFNSKIMASALVANGTAFDGTAFFATSRPNLLTGGNVIDNLYTGTGTTQAQITADFEGALAKMLGFRDSNDDALNAGAKPAVIIPIHLLPIFRKILVSQYFAGGVDNLNQNAAEIIVNWSQAATDNDWYIANLASALPPFIITNREQPVWDVDDPKFGKWINYGYTFRKGIGYGNPISIIKINN